MQLDKDIEQVIESIKEPIYFSGLMIPTPYSNFPSVQLVYPSSAEQKINGVLYESYNFELRIFAPYNLNWNENERTTEQVEAMEQMKGYLRSIVNILSDSNHTFGYKRGQTINYIEHHSVVSENKYFGIVATGTLQKAGGVDCCLTYDPSEYMKSNWAN